jgi:hypothetical protein
LPTVYTLRGKRKEKKRKEKKRKEIVVQIIQEKKQKIPTHDSIERLRDQSAE